MEFKKINLSDIKIIKPYFKFYKDRTCDYTVGGMFMWRDYYKMEYSIENNILFSRLYFKDNFFYNIPLCQDLNYGLAYLLREQKQNKISFCTVPEKYLTYFYDLDVQVKCCPQENLYDYLYSLNDLLMLPGKKYSSQRNLIHQFISLYPDWEFKKITEMDIKDIKKFFVNEKLNDVTNDNFETEERLKTQEVIDFQSEYNLMGGALLVNGKVVGFSFGEILGDTIFVHIEKARRDIKGVYQMLANQFIKCYSNPFVAYVNREEDMGDIGLRIAKQRYHPVCLLKKYSVEINI